MTTVCYMLVYIFEVIIAYIYFENKYDAKRSKKFLFVSYALMGLIQYSVNLLGIPNANLIVFFAVHFAVSYICYKSSILQSVFNAFILTVLMFTSELCIFCILGLFFNMDIMAYSTNETVLIIEAASSKLFYFLIAFIISKVSIKEKHISFSFSKSSMLFLLPASSVLLLVGIAYTIENFQLNDHVYMLFSVATILLIYANVIVFWVHEHTIKTQYENTELKLQKQKSKLDTEYYLILQNQYENSNILIHDIKRHLMAIKELAADKDVDRINRYIDNLYDNYQIKSIKKYSNNKLINAIINRYVSAFNEKDIDFFCDIRDIDFSFVSDDNITSLFDNLLENALEASQNAEIKNIELTVNRINLNFISINVWNYCSNIPKLINGKLVTTKRNSNVHGFGIKSIERIAKQYDGNVNYTFDKEQMKFTTTIVIKTQNNQTEVSDVKLT